MQSDIDFRQIPEQINHIKIALDGLNTFQSPFTYKNIKNLPEYIKNMTVGVTLPLNYYIDHWNF